MLDGQNGGSGVLHNGQFYDEAGAYRMILLDAD
jgi:hypothetical protein